jgi:hypothetical protein
MMTDIIETKSEVRNGIKYTTHYVNRSIRQGDPHGNSLGYTTPEGKQITTEIINYVYLPLEEGIKKLIEIVKQNLQ